jgi:hypothetical protein
MLRAASLICAVALLMAAAPAMASCDEDTIDTVSSDGDLIILSSGDAYDVAAGDDETASTWNEGDNVLMCGDVIINKDDSGAKVAVSPH